MDGQTTITIHPSRIKDSKKTDKERVAVWKLNLNLDKNCGGGRGRNTPNPSGRFLKI